MRTRISVPISTLPCSIVGESSADSDFRLPLFPAGNSMESSASGRWCQALPFSRQDPIPSGNRSVSSNRPPSSWALIPSLHFRRLPVPFSCAVAKESYYYCWPGSYSTEHQRRVAAALPNPVLDHACLPLSKSCGQFDIATGCKDGLLKRQRLLGSFRNLTIS
jgi:hypothetical protein